MSTDTMTNPSSQPVVNIWKFVIGFVVIFGLAAVAGIFFREPIYAFGSAVVDRYGLLGLGVAVLLVDSIPTPLSYGHSWRLDWPVVCRFWSVLGRFPASYVAGWLGYGVGRVVGMPPRFERWILGAIRGCGAFDQYGGWGLQRLPFCPCRWRWEPGRLARCGCVPSGWRLHCCCGFRDAGLRGHDYRGLQLGAG